MTAQRITTQKVLAQILSSNDKNLDKSDYSHNGDFENKNEIEASGSDANDSITMDSKQVYRLFLQCKYNMLGGNLIVRKIEVLLGLKI